MNKKLVASELAKIAEVLLADGPVFDEVAADEWVNKLTSSINAPVVKANKSTLGGPERTSILILISLDEKKDWYNGILENSRYFRMHLYNTGELDIFSGGGPKVKKFRKTKVKTVEEAIAKINKYIGEVKQIEKWY